MEPKQLKAGEKLEHGEAASRKLKQSHMHYQESTVKIRDAYRGSRKIGLLGHL